jgi:hypothetical protein
VFLRRIHDPGVPVLTQARQARPTDVIRATVRPFLSIDPPKPSVAGAAGTYPIQMIHNAPLRRPSETVPQAAAIPEPPAASQTHTVLTADPETIQTKIIRSAPAQQTPDLNQMINQVYDQLEKRLKFDRRRTGLM